MKGRRWLQLSQEMECDDHSRIKMDWERVVGDGEEWNKIVEVAEK